MSGRTIRWVVLGLLAIGLTASIVLSGGGYQVIEEMEQYINGKQATVKGRIRWPQNTTIHVYIPNDPQGAGAEQEVQAACKAWEAKLRSETNASLTFQYHVGESAPPIGPNDPPPYVIEVNWTDEETTTAGSSTSIATKAPTSLTRAMLSTTSPFTNSGTSSDSTTRHPTKILSSWTTAESTIPVRGLQDLNGRNPNSTVPPKEDDEDEEEDETGEPSGTKCCAFECGGAFGCTMVHSEVECAAYGGVIQPGTCEAASQEDQDQGVYGRCNGSLDPIGSCCDSDLGSSQYSAAPGAVAPGGQAFFILSIANDGDAPTWFAVSFLESPWLGDPVTESSTGFAPGSEPFEAPPALSVGCIRPGGQVTITYRAAVRDDAPTGEPVASTILLEDTLQRELYVFIAEFGSSGEDYASVIPEDVQVCARTLAWESGRRHSAHRAERWSVRERSPREMCDVCGAPMCVVCMEYDLGTYHTRPGVTSSQRSCLRTVERYLRTATREKSEVLAAVYWEAYWDGRHNRNRP